MGIRAIFDDTRREVVLDGISMMMRRNHATIHGITARMMIVMGGIVTIKRFCVVYSQRGGGLGNRFIVPETIVEVVFVVRITS